MTAAAWITAAVAVLFGSGSGGGLTYWLLNHNSERAQVAKINADRENTLADATEKWQKMLNDSRAAAFQEIQSRCQRCEHALQNSLAALDSVVVAGREVLTHLPPFPEDSEVLEAITDLETTIHGAQQEIARHK